ncbi:MAG: TraB/GumN family protein [Oscillospiraceae bacterium]|nr:TraB/GumN family protein [Oscillospiraceae bacterium]
MKKRILSFLLILTMLLSLAACKSKETTETTAPTEVPTETTETPTEPPVPTAHELYAQAVEDLQKAEHLTLEFTAQEEYLVWKETYTSNDSGTIRMENLQDEPVVSVQGSVSYNKDTAMDYSELFVGGASYSTFDGIKARDEVTSEDYLRRLIPAVLFDAENFASGETEESATGTILKFSDAIALEDWVTYEYSVLKEATAELTVGDDGISSMSYCANFRQGAADLTVKVETQISCPTQGELSTEAPEDAESYTLMDYSWIPQVMTQALSNLQKSNSMSQSVNRYLYSEALGEYTEVFATLSYSHMSKDVYYASDSTIRYMDSEGDETYNISESYMNGALEYSFNGQTDKSSVPASYVLPIVQEYFTEYLPQASYVTGAKVSSSTGELLLELTMDNEDAVVNYRGMTDGQFTGDPDILYSVATDYTTNRLVGYLGIDPDTLLPTSFGFDYEGVHTIEGYECVLSQMYHSKLVPSDPEALATITGKPEKESEPDTPATPLFYHVTGEDGSEMWLLGTIHVGDERTGFLPQEIYDAFEASDALAVEFNLNKHMEDMEEDEDYTSKIAELYYYSDGSTVKDHLSEEAYEAALAMMKYCGEYNEYMDYMKPFVWQNTIDNTYLAAGRRLTGDKGVDQRLLDLAEKQGKEILDVESAESQVTMLSTFSDKLQEYLLMSTVHTSRSAYNEGVFSLFELWCSGDEDALKDYIRGEESEDEDTEEELTEEEQQLQEEYESAIQTERDIDMVAVAKEYLSSGKTVFYAVGLAHLLAEDGLVDSLRAAGYTVELVTFANE